MTATILKPPPFLINCYTVDWGLIPNTQTLRSPLSNATQTLELPGSIWSLDGKWQVITESDWRQWEAFKAQLRGQANQFYYGPPHAPAPQGTWAGTPVVNVASQTGNTINLRGFTANSVGVAQVGDYLHFVTPDGWQEMHIVVAADPSTPEPYDSDSSGHVALLIEPPIRTSPADGAAIVTQNPCAIFMQTSDAVPITFTAPTFAAFEWIIVEAFS